MKKILPLLLLALSACNQAPEQTSESAKGELKFLLNYSGKLPSDVGFMTNHIVERRIANLLKEKFEDFQKAEGLCELPLVVEENVITAHYTLCSDKSVIVRNVSIDAAQDAVWVAEKRGGSASVKADHPKLRMPQELLRFKN
ncbi:MAG: hypothetical protein IPN22_00100 [Bacteroidetes bacterium]|nr:hypothetical protein [Bacteroidota bacterium]